jgi:hypothetical protein
MEHARSEEQQAMQTVKRAERAKSVAVAAAARSDLAVIDAQELRDQLGSAQNSLNQAIEAGKATYNRAEGWQQLCHQEVPSTTFAITFMNVLPSIVPCIVAFSLCLFVFPCTHRMWCRIPSPI